MLSLTKKNLISSRILEESNHDEEISVILNKNEPKSLIDIEELN